MQNQTSADWALANDILNGVESILVKSFEAGKPLEIDPSRSRLFEMFVTAEGAGYLEEESDPDLSADGLCRTLAQRWGLDDATRESVALQEKLPPEQLAKMRLLWSVMRMWMEWSYAWGRWTEFHPREE
jgi:hypothetical protein